jgi:predicted TIM-barrel fold metal-dependent hydrolase
MMIDIFTHILPPKYLNSLEKKMLKNWHASRAMEHVKGVPTLYDIDERFRIMDKYPGLWQVLTIGSPAAEDITNPEDAIELSQIANDALAELVTKYPDRFPAAIACLPLCDIDASLKELDRAIKDLRLRGIQLLTHFNRKPLDDKSFMPLYERMVYYDLPILIHPDRLATTPDYEGETNSKYLIWTTLGWPLATSTAMMRLAGSGIFEKYPGIKFITHHAGGIVPYLANRISTSNEFNEMRTGYRYDEHLTRKMTDYLRMFYTDTAVYGCTSGLMCAYDFFGADKMLFATDCPFDCQNGDKLIRETIRSVNEMNISDIEKKKIYEGNARKLMRLPD